MHRGGRQEAGNRPQGQSVERQGGISAFCQTENILMSRNNNKEQQTVVGGSLKFGPNSTLSPSCYRFFFSLQRVITTQAVKSTSSAFSHLTSARATSKASAAAETNWGLVVTSSPSSSKIYLLNFNRLRQESVHSDC